MSSTQQISRSAGPRQARLGAGRAAPRRRRGPVKLGRVRIGFWMVLPPLLIYSGIVAYPTIMAIYYSFTNWDGLGTGLHFVGFSNYVTALVRDPQVGQAFVHTILAALVITVGGNLVGLASALALQRRNRLNYVLRLLWFLPAALPTIIAGYIWLFLYSPQGPLVEIWKAVLPHVSVPGFLGNPNQALWCIIAIAVWQSTGFAMIIFLAALEGIQPEIIEAAQVDGAGYFRRLRRITLPLLRPALGVSAVITVMNGMFLFGEVIATTGGGPGYSSQTLTTELFRQAFEFEKFGYGMAVGNLLAVISVAVAAGVLWMVSGHEH